METVFGKRPDSVEEKKGIDVCAGGLNRVFLF